MLLINCGEQVLHNKQFRINDIDVFCGVNLLFQIYPESPQNYEFYRFSRHELSANSIHDTACFRTVS
jgi:hypothetical protein